MTTVPIQLLHDMVTWAPLYKIQRHFGCGEASVFFNVKAAEVKVKLAAA